MIEAEKQGETARIIERVGREGALDLEAVEFYIRSAVLALGATVLERLLHDVGVGRQVAPRLCAHLHPPRKMESTGVREKTLQTVLGPVRFGRSRLRCPECGAVEYLGDDLLGVDGTGFSPGLRRLMTRAGSRDSFAEAAGDLRLYGAIQADPKDVERVAESTGRLIDDWMRAEGSTALLGAGSADGEEEPIPILYVALDGTGTPMRKSELQGVRGKAQDGQAKTREVKLGCVFTQTALDDKGQPVRDPHSTTYVGAIESSSDFGHRLYQEAVRRGLKRAQIVVLLGDGAPYNGSIAHEHFSQAIHIIDFYHASERLTTFVKDNTAHSVQGAYHQQCYALLEDGRIEELIERMRQALPRSGARRKTGVKRIAYYAERVEQMRYAKFRAQGLFVGSGVIEAGCKTLIGKRLKQSGMFWSVTGANAIIAARCCLYSGRFEQFWECTGS
jgi:hypothetical protein